MRWLSEFSSLDKIYKSYETVDADLQSIAAEDAWDETTKAEPQVFKRMLTDTNLIEFLNFMLDTLNTLSYLNSPATKVVGNNCDSRNDTNR